MGLIVPTTIHPEREDQPLPYEWFVGIDWGSQQHQVYVLDRDRRRVGERVVDHDGASLARLADWLWTLSAGQPQRVAVAIEVPRGAIVEGLLERGFHVFAINPKQLDRFRDQLHRFYPQMLELCSAADEPWLWDLIDLAPTPAHVALLSEEQVQRVLKAHRIRRVKAKEVLTCLQALALPVAPGAAEAAQAHCQFLLPCLRVLAEQLQACSQQVSALLHTLAEEPGDGE